MFGVSLWVSFSGVVLSFSFCVSARRISVGCPFGKGGLLSMLATWSEVVLDFHGAFAS